MRTCLCVCVCWVEFVQHFSFFNILSTFFNKHYFLNSCLTFSNIFNIFQHTTVAPTFSQQLIDIFQHIFNMFSTTNIFLNRALGDLGAPWEGPGGHLDTICRKQAPSNINVLHYEWPHWGFRRTLWAPSARIVSTKAGPRKASSRRQKGRPRQRQDDDGSPQEPTEPPQGA